MREHVYEIESVVHLPKHGTHRFYTRLRLSEHSEASDDLAGGVQLYEMNVEQNSMRDGHGSETPIVGKDDMRRLFFNRLTVGELAGPFTVEL